MPQPIIILHARLPVLFFSAVKAGVKSSGIIYLFPMKEMRNKCISNAQTWQNIILFSFSFVYGCIIRRDGLLPVKKDNIDRKLWRMILLRWRDCRNIFIRTFLGTLWKNSLKNNIVNPSVSYRKQKHVS